MNYVYRYIDTKDNIVKYIGIVCRDGDNALEKRIYEHKRSDVGISDFKNFSKLKKGRYGVFQRGR